MLENLLAHIVENAEKWATAVAAIFTGVWLGLKRLWRDSRIEELTERIAGLSDQYAVLNAKVAQLTADVEELKLEVRENTVRLEERS